MKKEAETLLSIVTEEEPTLIEEWLKEARVSDQQRRAVQVEATQLLHALRDALRNGADPAVFEDERWSGVGRALEALSSSRLAQGQNAGETSMFVLAFKRPLLSADQRRLGADNDKLMETVWQISSLVDKMANKGIIHRNAAARYKSRLVKQLARKTQTA